MNYAKTHHKRGKKHGKFIVLSNCIWKMEVEVEVEVEVPYPLKLLLPSLWEAPSCWSSSSWSSLVSVSSWVEHPPQELEPCMAGITTSTTTTKEDTKTETAATQETSWSTGWILDSFLFHILHQEMMSRWIDWQRSLVEEMQITFETSQMTDVNALFSHVPVKSKYQTFNPLHMMSRAQTAPSLNSKSVSHRLISCAGNVCSSCFSSRMAAYRESGVCKGLCIWIAH